MCQKTNITKRFFLLVHHAHPHQQPSIVSVMKETPFVKQIYNETKFSPWLQKRDLYTLGQSPSTQGKEYLIPVDIPRDWFLH